jgi:hypothetical protein
MIMKIDLHCHSEASTDCLSPLTEFPARCREQGLRVQAITDHNEVWGAQKLREIVAAETGAETPLTIIVGEEVSTRDGEIIGLFLEEKIPRDLSAAETVARIREQNGLVLLPHGFDPLKSGRLHPDALEEIAGEIDIVEIFNARISFPRYNRKAAEWARHHQAPASAGTDAHRLEDVGAAWTETPERPIEQPVDLLAALQEGRVKGEWTHPVLAFIQKKIGQWRVRLQNG